MNKYVKMVIVLAAISLVSGLSLGLLNAVTKEQIDKNVLKFKKVPALLDISQGFLGELSADDKAELEKKLLDGRIEIEYKAQKDGEEVTEKKLLFVAEKDGKPYSVFIESFGQGYGGPVGTMVGITIESGDLSGLGITTISETPGVGSRATEESFKKQFRGMSGKSTWKIGKDGGDIDAISGATITSRAVSDAVDKATGFYKEHKDEIIEKTKK